jgi:putative protease
VNPSFKKPELLIPAGNLEKLKIAFAFGADAVFVGGNVFGLRKYADNFSLSELKEGIQLANKLGKQVYLVLNGFAHQSDMENLVPYLKELEAIQPHAFIISDMGVFQLAKKHTTVPLHVSTQASVTNGYTCQMWKEAGAKRVILAREVSIPDCRTILDMCDIELEIFIHGAMCASYSGKCVISNYSSGRDSNRGGCVQSCRHNYHVHSEQADVDYTAHIMNAKDLNGLMQIPAAIQAGVASLKIEGRMKSNLYVANVTSTYRQAIDYYMSLETRPTPSAPPPLLPRGDWNTYLSDVSNRQFSTGGLEDRPGAASINTEFSHYEKNIDYVGTVKQCSPELGMIIDVKGPFSPNDNLGILQQHSGDRHLFSPAQIHSLSGSTLEKTNPNSLVIVPYMEHTQVLDVLFKVLNPPPSLP